MSYLRGSGCQEIVNLLVESLCAFQIFHTADLCLDKMVAVNSCRDSSSIHSGRHELKDGHLRSRDVRNRRAEQCVRLTCAVASWQATR